MNGFQCSDGNGIPIAKKCNYDIDCADRSDENICKYQIIARSLYTINIGFVNFRDDFYTLNREWQRGKCQGNNNYAEELNVFRHFVRVVFLYK